jgi:hypothetical protein
VWASENDEPGWLVDESLLLLLWVWVGENGRTTSLCGSSSSLQVGWAGENEQTTSRLGSSSSLQARVPVCAGEKERTTSLGGSSSSLQGGLMRRK